MERHIRRGFTLIELLVAMTIVMILTVVGIVNYGSAQKNARDAKRKSDVEKVRVALEMYKQDHDGCYPANANWFLVNEKYIDKMPIDPLGISYMYDVVPYAQCNGSSNYSVGYDIWSYMEMPKNNSVPAVNRVFTCDINTAPCESKVLGQDGLDPLEFEATYKVSNP